MDDESLFSDQDAAVTGLEYPFAATPAPGVAITVAPGVYWVRMPMPMRLDHINLWLIEDGEGFVIVDTGLRTREIQACWETLLQNVMGDRPVTRIIVTHMHPDHVGMAGWLHQRTGAPLLMTRTEYLVASLLTAERGDSVPEDVLAFYRAAGFNDDQLEARRKSGFGNFARVVSPLPVFHHRLTDGQILRIGGRDWQIVVGEGHSPEHACLMCAELGVIITGDQILPRISPNVSVFPREPEADPLGDWLRSLHRLKAFLPANLLAFPAHNEPFYGLQLRLQSLIDGHCAKLERLARNLGRPKRAIETLNTLFGQKFEEPLVLGMAIGETLAHLRFLEAAGLVERQRRDGVDFYQRRATESPTRPTIAALAARG